MKYVCVCVLRNSLRNSSFYSRKNIYTLIKKYQYFTLLTNEEGLYFLCLYIFTL